MNATTQAIIARLPTRDLLTPVDIAAAYGMMTAKPILADIKIGRLGANVVGGRYLISRDEAKRYIVANEYIPDEGELPKVKKEKP